MPIYANDKTRVLNDIFIKFSVFKNYSHDNKVFSNTFGATAQAVILEKNTNEIINESIDDLIESFKVKSLISNDP